MNASRLTALLLALTVTVTGTTGCQSKGYAKPIETPSSTSTQR